MGTGVYFSAYLSVTKVHAPTLLALIYEGVSGCPISGEKALRNTWMASKDYSEMCKV